MEVLSSAFWGEASTSPDSVIHASYTLTFTLPNAGRTNPFGKLNRWRLSSLQMWNPVKSTGQDEPFMRTMNPNFRKQARTLTQRCNHTPDLKVHFQSSKSSIHKYIVVTAVKGNVVHPKDIWSSVTHWSQEETEKPAWIFIFIRAMSRKMHNQRALKSTLHWELKAVTFLSSTAQ
jgi:hypothetical protein